MMRNWAVIVVLLILSGCREKSEESYFTPAKAIHYFKIIEDLCNSDNGKLWGSNIYGPVMFVERSTRRVTANTADNLGILKGKEGIFTGLYPKELLINNSPVVFGGVTYALVPLPTEEDEFRIKSRAIHGLFHRFQEQNGITPNVYNESNMDEHEARIWIKLEWKALRKAINSDGETRLRAIRDALVFRGSNRELYQSYATGSNRFEAYEGLATFTYIRMCSASNEEFRTRLFEYLDRIYAMPSYARSYGFIHGALYATLLYESGYDLKSLNNENQDLGKQVKEFFNIELPPICRDIAGSLALSYDFDIISREEEQRLKDIQERLNKQISIFTEKNVVYLELESPSFDFEPEDIHPLDTLGTLYNTMRVSDNWGKLAVDKGGCLVSNNYKFMRLPAKGYKADKNRISGEGWSIILNDNWEVVKVDQNYFLRKLQSI